MLDLKILVVMATNYTLQKKGILCIDCRLGSPSQFCALDLVERVCTGLAFLRKILKSAECIVMIFTSNARNQPLLHMMSQNRTDLQGL